MASRRAAFDPFALARLAFQQQQLMMSSFQTIWWRSARAMAGTMSPAEFTGMVSEKPLAFAKSVQKATSAAMRNKPALEVARQAILPLEQKASSNAKRLGRRKGR
ncbi:MAG TPA: hypothetical protein VKN63_11945 [Afifellaceae bacterium]|nr:hypothetical protein [Afifellaceae bacterium]